jgi:hypothetical protein
LVHAVNVTEAKTIRKACKGFIVSTFAYSIL